MKTNQLPHSSINPHTKIFGVGINIGILGLGTVGSAVAELIASRPELGLKVKKGADLRKVKVPCPTTRDPNEIINDPDISVVVETIGGVEAAKPLVLAALRAGKHVVTSNKELIALYLDELLRVAKANGVSILFEGAVGGGIPVINTIRDSLMVNNISEIYGIVNGTTNYILSRMTTNGNEFNESLKEAQTLGFAEANPEKDIEGYDAAYKAAILASVAYGAKIKMVEVYREGIEKISPEDIAYASDIGYVIKLLAIARRAGDELDVRVHPALVAKTHPLASVNANFNAIFIKGEPVGELMLYGQGAGGGPTASAIVSDILSIRPSSIIHRPSSLTQYKMQPIEEIESRYYIRLQAPDKHGVLAGIAQAFADQKVSIAAVTQKENVGNQTTIVILLHKVAEKNVRAALTKIGQLAVVKKVCNVIRIL